MASSRGKVYEFNEIIKNILNITDSRRNERKSIQFPSITWQR